VSAPSTGQEDLNRISQWLSRIRRGAWQDAALHRDRTAETRRSARQRGLHRPKRMRLRRRRSWLSCLTLALFATSIASCSSIGQSNSASHPDATSPVSTGSGAGLEFRAVKQTLVNKGGVCPVPGSFVSMHAGVIFSDRSGLECYLLGPVLLTGADVHSATVLETAASQWAVHLQFKDNEWVKRVARPLVSKRVALVLDGVVRAAPRIEPGYAADDVDVLGSPLSYSRSEAIEVAAGIRGVAPSVVRVRSLDPASP
jgi:hypothetical protein